MIKMHIPQKNPCYVPTKLANTLRTVMKSNIFYPILLTGHTGIGKTFEPRQVCAEENLECIRVNISIESDEDSLMGGFRLKDGSTVFHKGPVIEAMERGCILLLDELDLGSPTRIMCLQSVLEGEGYLIKKTGEFVMPRAGFNIIATANTKGIGDESGLYVGTQILNEAFLDRFPIVIDVEYPSKDDEYNRIVKVCEQIGVDSKLHDKDINLLLNWAFEIRKSNENSDDLENNISSRRLSQIMVTYKLFGENMREAIKLSINRFDNHHKEEYMKMFDLLANPEEKMKKEQMANREKDELMEMMGKYKPF